MVLSFNSESIMLKKVNCKIKANYISLPRGMSNIYLETYKNTNMQIKIILMNKNDFDFKKLLSHPSKRSGIHRVG